MPANNSPLALEGLKEILDRALASERGIKVVFSGGSPEQNSATATYQRGRMHKLRVDDRNSSMQVYPEDHPLRGQSPWDALMISKVYRPDGACELHILKTSLTSFQIEEL